MNNFASAECLGLWIRNSYVPVDCYEKMVVNDLGRGWRDCWDGERDRYYKDCYCKRIRMLPGVLSLKKWGVLFVPGGVLSASRTIFCIASRINPLAENRLKLRDQPERYTGSNIHRLRLVKGSAAGRSLASLD